MMFRIVTEETGRPSDLALETPCEALARHTLETLVLPKGGRITLFSGPQKLETIYCLPLGHYMLTGRAICPSMGKVRL